MAENKNHQLSKAFISFTANVRMRNTYKDFYVDIGDFYLFKGTAPWNLNLGEWLEIRKATKILDKLHNQRTNNHGDAKKAILGGYDLISRVDYISMKIFNNKISEKEKKQMAMELTDSMGTVNERCASLGINLNLVDNFRRT